MGATAERTAAKREFFARDMYVVAVDGWESGDPPPDRPDQPVLAAGAARLRVWPTDPRDGRHVPPPGDAPVICDVRGFSLANSGNRTLRAPKRSWKVDLDVPGGDDERVAGMSCLNLKAMYNDPSQMREAIAWRLFGEAGVPSSRHTYARFAVNGRYRGLFSVVEQVDKTFLAERFGPNRHGNLYKAYCGGIGCATLQHRTGADGADDGRAYLEPGGDDPTYRLRTNKDDTAANTYDDLATLIRSVDGVGLPGGDGRFTTDAFRDSVREVLDADAFLRWAGVNVLLGSWDNYFATPANYYLYNGGRPGAEHDFVAQPWFRFIPWDYDNCLGVDYVGTRWAYTDLLDWPGNTVEYGRRNSGGRRSRIPLVEHLLANPDFRLYYLDHLEFLLDTSFSPTAVLARLAPGASGGLWDRVRHAAYLESDTPHGAPFTGRQFTNDEVYRAGCDQWELRHADAHIEGIYHYVRMRYDSARAQLAELRRTHPRGGSGATFAAAPAPEPARI